MAGYDKLSVIPNRTLTRRFVLALGVATAGGILLARIWENALNRQSITREVGQMMMVGFIGANSSSPGFRRLIDLLKRGIVGGVLFLPRNIVSRAQLKIMIAEVRRCGSQTVPLIAIDEEGGTVDWLSETLGFEPIASAADIGRGGVEQARQQYAALAEKLLDVGFNMNMGPVVDLNKNPQNPIIGVRGRSFSPNPAVVERYAQIFITEHHARDILTVLKHFPGHGSSTSDTHQVAADVTATWSADELAPYRALIGDGMVDAVMVGHLVNRNRWGGIATQDGSTAISALLRRELHFNGVVVSDDLTMEAVRHTKKRFSAVVISAIKAGVDLVLIVHPTGEDIEELSSAVIEAVLSGQIPRATISSSWRRIIALKAQLLRSRH